MNDSKILIVDDKPANLFALKRLLRYASTEILEASSGPEALGIILQHDLALILLDVDMPGMDGYDLAEMLRGVNETRHIPIIFLTAAFKDTAHLIRGNRSGGVDYLEKPLNEEVILSKVNVFLELHRVRHAQERHLARLRQSEAKFRAMVDHVAVGMLRLDLQGQILEANQSVATMLDYTPDELGGRRLDELISPQDLPARSSLLEPLINMDLPSYRMESRFVRKYGELIWGEWTATLIAGTEQDPGFIVVAIQESTERRLAQESLLQEQERLLRVLLNAPDEDFFLIDLEGRFLIANDAIQERFRTLTSELIGHRLEELLPPEGYRLHQEMWTKAIREQQPCFFEDELFGRRRANRIYPVVNKDGIVDKLAVYAIDVTEQRDMESRALRNAQLATVGTLAASVAHEVNNPNNAILFQAQWLQKAWHELRYHLQEAMEKRASLRIAGRPLPQAQQTCDEFLVGIVDNSHRIEKIVANLKHLSSPDRGERPVPLDLNVVILSAKSILEHQIHRHGARCQLTLADDLPLIQGHSTQMEQLVINILLNALQALPGPHGEVHVTTSLLDNRVVLCIADRGVGISEAHLGQVTVPFFTTRADVGGTGLGLSISAAIVRQHRGQLEIQSTPGKGTTVTASFPLPEL
jgi:PAS domain S-box-containing protein